MCTRLIVGVARPSRLGKQIRSLQATTKNTRESRPGSHNILYSWRLLSEASLDTDSLCRTPKSHFAWSGMSSHWSHASWQMFDVACNTTSHYTHQHPTVELLQLLEEREASKMKTKDAIASAKTLYRASMHQLRLGTVSIGLCFCTLGGAFKSHEFI